MCRLLTSPTKLSFLFYDFYVVYCDFFKNSAKIKKKDKTAFETRSGT